jgi:C-terminal processing protease CtpA/Prc
MIGIHLKLEDPTVVSVDPNGAAAAAGMKPGQRILKVNETPISTGKDVVAVLRATAKWGAPTSVVTDVTAYSIVMKRPTEARQCYWDVSAGSVGENRGIAYVNQYGGSAGQRGSEYQRFFRTSCRFFDGRAVSCQSNWQE